jgi:small subunit ribosomal protein S2
LFAKLELKPWQKQTKKRTNQMKDVSLSELLKSGAHFGHQTSRWNPKMAPFIFTVRNNIHILDLAKTREKLLAAMEFAKEVAAKGGVVLFVGTKRQAKEHVRAAAVACGSPYVVTRWLGGTFTNFRTIQKTIKKMERYETLKANGELEKNYTKKERLLIERELVKLKTLFEGIKDLRKLPEAIVVFDINYDEIAVVEAKKSKVKIIGVVDTNCNPDGIDYPIPSNDDAIKAISLICQAISDAVNEGKKNFAAGSPSASASSVVSASAAPLSQSVAATEDKNISESNKEEGQVNG